MTVGTPKRIFTRARRRQAARDWRLLLVVPALVLVAGIVIAAANEPEAPATFARIAAAHR